MANHVASHVAKTAVEAAPIADPGWRLTHLGRLLGHALRRFDERVLQLMAVDVQVPLALSNLRRAIRSARRISTSRGTWPWVVRA